jgi:hypothetical protein
MSLRTIEEHERMHIVEARLEEERKASEVGEVEYLNRSISKRTEKWRHRDNSHD